VGKGSEGRTGKGEGTEGKRGRGCKENRRDRKGWGRRGWIEKDREERTGKRERMERNPSVYIVALDICQIL